jgi:hypothetical protein
MVIGGKGYTTSASHMVCISQFRGVYQEFHLWLKTDIIICEDDPYSFLQFPAYNLEGTTSLNSATPQEYLASLVPSFLKYDMQGRVIRLDTFSKVHNNFSKLSQEWFLTRFKDVGTWNPPGIFRRKSNVYWAVITSYGSWNASSKWMVPGKKLSALKSYGIDSKCRQ